MEFGGRTGYKFFVDALTKAFNVRCMDEKFATEMSAIFSSNVIQRPDIHLQCSDSKSNVSKTRVVFSNPTL